MFRAIDLAIDSVDIMAYLLEGLAFLPENIELSDGLFATEEAYKLVTEKGVPFRDAHEIVGKAVGECVTEGIALIELPIERLQQFHGVDSVKIPTGAFGPGQSNPAQRLERTAEPPPMSPFMLSMAPRILMCRPPVS